MMTAISVCILYDKSQYHPCPGLGPGEKDDSPAGFVATIPAAFRSDSCMHNRHDDATMVVVYDDMAPKNFGTHLLCQGFWNLSLSPLYAVYRLESQGLGRLT